MTIFGIALHILLVGLPGSWRNKLPEVSTDWRGMERTVNPFVFRLA